MGIPASASQLIENIIPRFLMLSLVATVSPFSFAVLSNSGVATQFCKVIKHGDEHLEVFNNIGSIYIVQVASSCKTCV